MNEKICHTSDLVGRVLISLIFLMAGLEKVVGYEGTQAYMDSMGVPGGLLPLVILTEIVGSIMVMVGFQTRWAALALAGFTVLSAFFFHLDFDDKMQTIMFMKNIAIAGGFMVIFSRGPGKWSLDHKRESTS